jgi:hypothetical protein
LKDLKRGSYAEDTFVIVKLEIASHGQFLSALAVQLPLPGCFMYTYIYITLVV